MAFDPVIRDGRWFDGTGGPSAIRTIGIRQGHIVAISPQPLDETDCLRVLEADGKWVLPGMFDLRARTTTPAPAPAPAAV